MPFIFHFFMMSRTIQTVLKLRITMWLHFRMQLELFKSTRDSKRTAPSTTRPWSRVACKSWNNFVSALSTKPVTLKTDTSEHMNIYFRYSTLANWKAANDQWSEISSDMKSFKEGKRYISSEELSDDDSANVVVMDKYIIGTSSVGRVCGR
jgi:hypothetical protein